MIGQSIGHYEITAKLGQGGMGEVYRARDTRLNRDVALKLLPEVFSQDKQRMGRFSREAQLLASLNHPNIAAIYGLEEIQAPASSPLSLVSGQTPSTLEPTPTRCLVMELVEGEDLSERIARGRIPLDEALSIAVQIAEALENAHEKGIIHRDLKPANVKLTTEGKVKVLDFGLAKALDDPASGLQSPTSAVSQSPTLSMAATQAGIIMGTAAYMSPEQARGKATDRRTDLWAFGCVLYEMLSGTQVFNGSDTSEIMARVITHDPDWSALPPTLPNPILRLLKRCLRKESAMRLPSAAMIRITILDYLDDPDEVLTARAKHRPGWLAMVLLVCAGVLFGVAISVLTRDGGAESSEEVIQVDLILDPPVELTQSPVVSPDGKTIVYTGRAKGTTQLFRRGFAENESTVIPGTEGGVSPFFSPDGRWVSFFAGGRLKKILLEGGQPIPVAVYAGTAVGGAWTRDDRIVFLSGGEGRPQVIPSSGGTVAILSPDQDRDILLKGAPQLLPGGMQMLVTVKSLERPEESHVGLLDSGTGQLKNLAAGSDPKVVAPGLISYLYGGSLMIARFDPQQGSLGPGRVAPVHVESYEGSNGRYIRGAFSSMGTALFETDRAVVSQKVAFVDWQGEVISEQEVGFLKTEVYGLDFFQVRLSPDGTRLVVSGLLEVGTVNLADGQSAMIHVESGSSGAAYAHWRPDGKSVAFISNRSGQFMTYHLAADGNSELELVADTTLPAIGTDFSPDGEYLLGYLISPETSRDLVLFPMDGGEPITILRTNSNERAPVFSPNGKLIAFLSDEDGTDQIYLREYPNGNRNIRVSTNGGSSAIWSRDGRHLFFRAAEALMKVEVQDSPVLQVGRPEYLFDASRYPIENFGIASYDISLDDRFFLFPLVERHGTERWSVILNADRMFTQMFNE